MENLNQVKLNNRNLYLKLDSLSETYNPDADECLDIITKALEAMSKHKMALETLLEGKKRKTTGSEIISKKVKTLFNSGDSVAVKVENVWILAIVGKYVSNLDKYSIIDAEDSKEYIISCKDILKIGEIGKFQVQSPVLALFPGTSCFYNATVLKIPSLPQDNMYTLLFEDDNGVERKVESKFVLHRP